MSLSPYTSTLSSGARASDATETYDIPTRGRKGLILVSDVTAIGNGQAYQVAGAAPTFPVVVDASNLNFRYAGNEFVVPTGSKATLALLVAAVNGAIATIGGARFDTVVTVSIDPDSPTKLRFTSVATGAVTSQLTSGASNDILAELGVTSTSAMAHGGADGTFSQTVSILGVDEASGKTWTILDAAAQSTVSTKVLKVGASLAAVTNLVANDVLPATVRVSIAHTTTNSLTRTIGAQLVS